MSENDKVCVVANLAAVLYSRKQVKLTELCQILSFLTKDEIIAGLNDMTETCQVRITDGGTVLWTGINNY